MLAGLAVSPGSKTTQNKKGKYEQRVMFSKLSAVVAVTDFQQKERS
jgi:hypothetical protein